MQIRIYDAKPVTRINIIVLYTRNKTKRGQNTYQCVFACENTRVGFGLASYLKTILVLSFTLFAFSFG